jgi:glucose/arabinose dehydrogenase
MNSAHEEILQMKSIWYKIRQYRMKFIVPFVMVACFMAAILGCSSAGNEIRFFPLPDKNKTVIKSEVQSFIVDTVVKGLVRPWSVTFLPNESVLIAERSGHLVLLKNGLPQDSVTGALPKSLRDVKLHPKFQENGLLYLSYYIEPTETDGGYTALMRGKLVGNKLTEPQVLYKAGPFRENGEWYGSKIAFDKKGYLYFSVGIRGDRKNAQDLSNPSGKTMRFNDDGTIPPDNPFIKTAGALPEIYTYGHRMHEGLVQNVQTGILWSSEFGELGGDEINVLRPGANYGWPEVTFSLEYSGKRITQDSLRNDVDPPVYHAKNAPSDIEFVYGDNYPNWTGNLLIGGVGRRLLMRTVLKDNKVIHEEVLLDGIGRVRDVKFGPDHYLYVLTEDTGLLVRIFPVKG